LDNVEKGLERAVNSAFARTFRAGLQPVELAGALRRELDVHAAVVSRERTIAPNSFRIHVSSADRRRLAGLGDALTDELVTAVNKHARKQGYELAGPAEVSLVEDPGLSEGMLAIDSRSVKSTIVWVPVLDVGAERHVLTGHRTVIGRSSQADITLDDAGVSRQHLEILWDEDTVTARDLGSTNGSRLDGEPLTEARLRPDCVISVGATRIVYRLVPRHVRDDAGSVPGPAGQADQTDQADPPEPWEST
jgi:hypothetical protein